MIIYAIMGSRGEHEEYQEYIVKAYIHEQSAESFLAQINDLQARLSGSPDYTRRNAWQEFLLARHPVIEQLGMLDPKASIETHKYGIVEIELVG